MTDHERLQYLQKPLVCGWRDVESDATNHSPSAETFYKQFCNGLFHSVEIFHVKQKNISNSSRTRLVDIFRICIIDDLNIIVWKVSEGLKFVLRGKFVDQSMWWFCDYLNTNLVFRWDVFWLSVILMVYFEAAKPYTHSQDFEWYDWRPVTLYDILVI